jgi:hypothetical protein
MISLVVMIVLALSFGNIGAALAQAGGIGNSTGIGSGLGVQGGTGPTYSNGTTVPGLPPSPPPGVGAAPALGGPSIPTVRPPSYPQPRAPFDAPGASTGTTPTTAAPAAAREPLVLPDTLSGDLAFLQGCWRSDVFQAAHHPGTSTWCFDGKGAGRYLYTRIDQMDYFCHGDATATIEGAHLDLHGLKASCTKASDPVPDDLDCTTVGGTAQCSGTDPAGRWTVRLYRVR